MEEMLPEFDMQMNEVFNTLAMKYAHNGEALFLNTVARKLGSHC